MKKLKLTKQKQTALFIGGFLVGVLNGLLGAGGGMLAVPLLNKIGLDTTKSHSSSIAVIFPITLVSAVLYMSIGQVGLSDALPYMPAGIVGAIVGGKLMVNLPQTLLRLLFAGFMIWAGIRLLTR